MRIFSCALACVLVLAGQVSVAVAAAPNAIVAENSLRGTSGWKLAGTVSSDTANEIKGYADQVSINRGESINFMVSVSSPQMFRMKVFRLGWYGGYGGRLMRDVGYLKGITQPACPHDTGTGLIACSWSPSYTLEVPSTWVSGVYLVKLHSDAGHENYITFTLRDDASQSDLLVQMSTHTWQAYNRWGGKSLYEPASAPAVMVSYDRPYAGVGTRVLGAEYRLFRWLERRGYDVSYTTDVDTHVRGELILNHRAFVSVWHDEYWTWEMRDAVEGARDAGVHLAFFGGNESYWQVRMEASTAGATDRVIVGYRHRYRSDPYYSSADPVERQRTTALFRHSVVGRPEQLMMGAMYGYNLGGQHTNNLRYTVRNATHWAYEGTGVSEGQILTKIVGREYNSVYPTYPLPANTSFVILGETANPNSNIPAQTVMYTAPSGAIVFAAGTMDWGLALDNYENYDRVSPELRLMTARILDRFVAGE